MNDFARANARRILVTLGAALCLATSRAALAATSISSPTVITAPGDYLVTADINAGGGTGIDIDASNVTLDLNGHTVSGLFGIVVCRNRSRIAIHGGSVSGVVDGILLQGPNHFVRVEQLQVTGTVNLGIRAPDCSDSLFRFNRITGGAGGVGVLGNNNHLCNNRVRSPELACIQVQGRNLRVICNVAFGARSGSGIFGAGVTDSTFANNTCTGNDGGLDLEGACTDNRLLRNKCSGNQTFGILIGGGCVRNQCEDNVAFNNGTFDLVDNNLPSCVNTWLHNFFTTDNESGANAGPGAGCVQ